MSFVGGFRSIFQVLFVFSVIVKLDITCPVMVLNVISFKIYCCSLTLVKLFDYPGNEVLCNFSIFFPFVLFLIFVLFFLHSSDE